MLCVSVGERDFALCKELVGQLPMVELREDLSLLSQIQVEELVAMHPNMIFTCRIAATSLEFARNMIFTAIRKGVKYVDVEIEAPQDLIDIVKLYAKENGTKLIISYHNYEGTENLDELISIAELCRRKGADIVKLATTANGISDAVRLLSLYKYFQARPDSFSSTPLVAFAMGEKGRFSRYLSLLLGAPYTYVSYGSGKETAPGQYTLEQMQKLLEPGGERLDYSLTQESVRVPCSKSVAQRAIIAAAFCRGECRLSNFEPCNDIVGALEIVKQLGCTVEQVEDNLLIIKSKGAKEIALGWSGSELNSGESGLLTRLLIPFAAYVTGERGGEASLKIAGKGSILGRNLGTSAAALLAAGASCQTKNGGYLPFQIGGKITEKRFVISGKESSQSVSGMLMTLPLLDHDTELVVENPASLPYIDLTLAVMEKFGVHIEREVSGDGKSHLYKVKGNSEYKACNLYMEADWSSAAFFAIAYAIASSIGGSYTLRGMPIGSEQADEAVLEVLKCSGVKLEFSGEKTLSGGEQSLVISAPEGLGHFSFDATNSPDLFPILALYATFCDGCSSIKGVNRLLEKESNRAESIYTELTKMGADITIEGDWMYIKRSTLHSANLHSHNDHRIAMMIIVASLFMKDNSDMRIDDIKCIDKSFPSFIGKL